MTGTPADLPRVYTAAEVAEALRCSKWWVLEQVRRGRIPCYGDVAGGYRFSVEHVATILRLRERRPVEAAPAPEAERRKAAASVVSCVEPTRLVARVPRRARDHKAA
jgi:Helix-turn-helix domain